MLFRPPWWQGATTVALSVALGIAVGAGRTIDSIIVGVLLLPAVILLALWVIA